MNEDSGKGRGNSVRDASGGDASGGDASSSDGSGGGMPEGGTSGKGEEKKGSSFANLSEKEKQVLLMTRERVESQKKATKQISVEIGLAVLGWAILISLFAGLYYGGAVLGTGWFVVVAMALYTRNRVI